jgi:ATP-dependent DNA helicase RecG
MPHSPAKPDVPLRSLKGIGLKRELALHGIGVYNIRDLLYYFPRDYLDRSKIVRISDLRKYVSLRKPVTVFGEVISQETTRARRTNRPMFFLTIQDESGNVQCVWFEGVQWYLDAFEKGEVLAVSAVPTLDKRGRVQFVHPQFDRLKAAEEDEPDWSKLFNTGAIIPKYRSTSALEKVGLDSRGFRRLLRNAINQHLDSIEESLHEDIRRRLQLPSLGFALSNIHFPADHDSLRLASQRLKFDELFFLQLLLALRRYHFKSEGKGISFSVASKLARQLVDSLPFELTKAQRRVVKEITDDMKSSRPMNRLIQGDVGSGKTVVALLAMLVAIDNGYQVAFMAPTEILAYQHYRTITSFLKTLPVHVRLLIGGQKKKLHEDVLQEVHRGSAHIVVGTHALIEERVAFANLGMAVIDEQHRFGVLQRAALREKGYNPDVLVMTATPIPRTLAMTVYGDLDISVLDEMPAHRKPIKTAVRLQHQKQKVYEFVKEEIRAGRQAYVVFPLIEESEKLDLKAATKEYEYLSKEIFPDFSVGLLHGRMKTEEKDDVMRRFKDGQIQVLVSTTVIEVGIDVPNATVMIIENAERFGLAQLHQLRGRVGRGAEQSYCVLIADYGWFDTHGRGKDLFQIQQEKENARVRLDTMVETTDGFKIAEVDLKLRGPGEFFGTRQSGIPGFRIANLVDDHELLSLARKEAFALVQQDPQLRLLSNGPIRKHFETNYKEIFDLGKVG